jgi:hypothetical protein
VTAKVAGRNMESLLAACALAPPAVAPTKAPSKLTVLNSMYHSSKQQERRNYITSMFFLYLKEGFIMVKFSQFPPVELAVTRDLTSWLEQLARPT